MTFISPPSSEKRVSTVARAGCRFCGGQLHTFIDLGKSPLCESFLSKDQLNRMEPFFPLHAFVCESCFLVQLEQYVSVEDIFTEYAYFSSYSDAWLAHAHDYVEMISRRLGLDRSSQVVELASNDGYLLQYFVARGIPVLGIEPARNVAAVAEAAGVPTLTEFFGADMAAGLAEDGLAADLIIGNNVLAQVPNLNSFVAGIPLILKPEGVVTIEVPHLMVLMRDNLFDTIYHEHFSYFSLFTCERIFAAHGLRLFDVEELWTHGGSLRLYGCHAASSQTTAAAVTALRQRELDAGLDRLATYANFAERVRETKRRLLAFLIQAKREGKSVVGYGAPGKANTLLNYCGIGPDFLDYTVDRNPYKHGKFTPGNHIPIHPPGRIEETRPDYVLILPWNLKDEIKAQLSFVRGWGGRFIVPIPELAVE